MFESTFVPEKPERSGTIALALILQTVAVAGFVIGPAAFGGCDRYQPGGHNRFTDA